MDGPWVPTAQRASIYTVVIYLNDAEGGGFSGGETNFLRPQRGEPNQSFEATAKMSGKDASSSLIDRYDRVKVCLFGR